MKVARMRGGEAEAESSGEIWSERRAARMDRDAQKRRQWTAKVQAQVDALHVWASSGPRKPVMTPSLSSLLPTERK